MAGAPFYGFAPTRQLPGQLEGIVPLVQGLGQFHQNNLFQQDLQSMQGLAPGAQFNPQSQQGQQMAFQNQMLGRQPMSPYQQATIGIQQGEVDARSQAARVAAEKAARGTARVVDFFDATGRKQSKLVDNLTFEPIANEMAQQGFTQSDPLDIENRQGIIGQRQAGEGRAESEEQRKQAGEGREERGEERTIAQIERDKADRLTKIAQDEKEGDRKQAAEKRAVRAAEIADAAEDRANVKEARDASSAGLSAMNTRGIIAARDLGIEEDTKNAVFRSSLEEQEKNGTITPKGELQLSRMRVGGSGQTINIGDGPPLTPEQEGVQAQKMQEVADGMNAGNEDALTRWEVKTSTTGKRTIDQVRKSESEINTVSQFRDILRRAERARELWKPGFTGLWQGSDLALKLKEKTGTMAPGEVEWRQNQDSLIKLLYAEAGKQLSDREMKIHFKRFPRSDVGDSTYDRQLDEFTRNLREDISSRQGGSGPSVYFRGIEQGGREVAAPTAPQASTAAQVTVSGPDDPKFKSLKPGSTYTFNGGEYIKGK